MEPDKIDSLWMEVGAAGPVAGPAPEPLTGIAATVAHYEALQRGMPGIPDGEYVMVVKDADFRPIPEGLALFLVLEIAKGPHKGVGLMKGYKIDKDDPLSWGYFVADMFMFGVLRDRIEAAPQKKRQAPFAEALRGKRMLVRYQLEAGGENALPGESLDVLRRVSQLR